MEKSGRAYFVVAFVSFFLSSTNGWACGTGKVLFSDNFATLSPTWNLGDGDSSRSNGPDGLTYSLKPKNSIDRLSNAALYDDYEVCGKFKVSKAGDQSASYGVKFWGVDLQNYYTFVVSNKYGTFAVQRIQRSRTLAQIDYRVPAAPNVDLIKKGGDSENELSVVVKGKHASFSINGTKVAEMDGLPPDNGSVPGFELNAMATNTADMSLTFENFEVREVK